METLNQKPQHSYGSRIMVGLVFLTVGLLLFAQRLDIIPFNYWSNYIFTWQGLLIGIGLIPVSYTHLAAQLPGRE